MFSTHCISREHLSTDNQTKNIFSSLKNIRKFTENCKIREYFLSRMIPDIHTVYVGITAEVNS